MKKSKILIIISVIVILAIVSAVLGYLYIATDIFRSDSELFGKYISQNIESFEKMIDLKSSEIYKNLKYENKYESNTNVKVTHSEGGEVSNPLNNLSAKIDIQKDDEEQYFYADAQILFDNEEYLEAEIIKEQELYGVRFTDVVKQFITVKEDEKFETVANNIGITSEELKQIINIIDEITGTTENIIEIEEINSLKDKYFNIIKNTITQGKFDGLRDAMITYDNQTIKTNAYSVELSSEQIENMVIEILNNIKTDIYILEQVQGFIDNEMFENIIEDTIKTITEENIVPGMKITVYEQKEKTIRTVLEMDSNKIILENLEENGELKSKIQLSILDGEQIIQYNVQISKNTTENQENFGITIQSEEAENLIEVNLLNEMKLEDNNYTFKTILGHKKNITTQEIVIENLITTGESFDKKQKLEQTNNVILNNLEEERQKVIINTLKEKVPQKVQTRLNLLNEALTIKENDSEQQASGNEISQIDINKFNAKFEFYAGEAVSYENVKTLLDIVKSNIANYEIIPVANDEGNTSKDAQYNIKLYIEQNKTNEEAINKVLEKLNDKKKYKVSIFYKQQNGIIDYIMINEVES